MKKTTPFILMIPCVIFAVLILFACSKPQHKDDPAVQNTPTAEIQTPVLIEGKKEPLELLYNTISNPGTQTQNGFYRSVGTGESFSNIVYIGLGTGFTVVCYIARRSLLGLFLQAGDAVRLAELFSIWLLLSGPVIGLYYIASNYLQATGSALSATVVSVLRQGALLIPLLYLMHAGFGLPGIAIAHALADLIATGIGIALFLRQYRRVCQSAVK